MIGKTLGNLKIISEIGRGGMGVVYLAEHKTLDKKFAVKSLSPALTEDFQFRERFYQEARNQALLDHPNIVQATDFFEDNQQFFFVMEYVDGSDLGEIIRTRGKLPEDEALAIFKLILEGLDYAHNKGIIHRDVKSPNVIIDASGRPRITDFGIAVMFGSQRHTEVGTPVGTAWYMSPEQITNPQNIDHRSDVYSAGILLYEMLTGEMPFDGNSEFSIKEKQVNAPRPDPREKNPEISAELAKIVLKAINKNPDNRFHGCAEFLDFIKKYEASKTPIPTRPVKWMLLSLTLIVIIGLGVATYKIIHPTRPSDAAPELLIDIGSKEAAILCRQFFEISIIHQNLEIAGSLGEVELAQGYKNQIHEKELNIQDGLTKYNDILKKLGALEKPAVNAEFSRYFKRLESEHSPPEVVAERKKIANILKMHYQEYSDQTGSINNSIMHDACMER